MASYDSQEKVVESDRWRGALGMNAWGFLREGLSDGRVAARDCDEMQRALTTIVELFRTVSYESHSKTVVIA